MRVTGSGMFLYLDFQELPVYNALLKSDNVIWRLMCDVVVQIVKLWKSVCATSIVVWRGSEAVSIFSYTLWIWKLNMNWK